MFAYDFSNHQNRFIHIEDTPDGYLEELASKAQSDPFYPRFHVAPPCGLTNDPCGLFESEGVHYVFHQWFPAGPVHGLKYWRLLTTRDFVSYEDHGVALAPGLPFDNHGCYTGMALPAESGEADVYYTGVAGEELDPTMCLARWKDGELRDRHVLVSRNPSLSSNEFRDPFVFEADGVKHMLVGSQSPDGRGQFLLYREVEGAFEPVGPLAFEGADADGKSLGYMYECPNYYEQDGRGVIFFAPMGLVGEGKYDFKNVFSVVYGVGAPLDVRAGAFRFETLREMDKGFDFYAPQTYRDETGRQILMGWLGNSKSPYPTDKNGWAHMLTVPRELRLEGSFVTQRPIVELEALREGGMDLEDTKTIRLDGAPLLDVDGLASGAFMWEIGNDCGDTVRFEATEGEFMLDRSAMSHLYAERFGTVRYARRLDQDTTVRLLVDTSSIELFVDNGKTVFTSRYFIDNPSYLHVSGVKGAAYRMGNILIAGLCYGKSYRSR
ncbi:MAG: sucrose-6-phosphate hydrolase [Atopobiaceae bacterium]|nr:sucrose-6-phosphate hydrolase [Atopobiaceae bacterium]